MKIELKKLTKSSNKCLPIWARFLFKWNVVQKRNEQNEIEIIYILNKTFLGKFLLENA